jgi:xanthine dehydrogenase accessory factor
MTMDGWDVLERARELSMRGEVCALATVVWRRGPSSGKEGCRAVITASGQVFGFIGGACAEPVVVREARHILAEGVPRLVFLGTPDELESVAVREGISYVPMSCQSEGALEIYIEPVEPKTHLVVVGRSPMVEALVQMGQAIGWRTVLVDPRRIIPVRSVSSVNSTSRRLASMSARLLSLPRKVITTRKP